MHKFRQRKRQKILSMNCGFSGYANAGINENGLYVDPYFVMIGDLNESLDFLYKCGERKEKNRVPGTDLEKVQSFRFILRRQIA